PSPSAARPAPRSSRETSPPRRAIPSRRLPLVHVVELGVHDVAVARRAGRLATAAGGAGRLTRGRSGQSLRRARERLLRAANTIHVAALQGVTCLGQRALGLRTLGVGQLRSLLGEQTLDGIRERVGLVAQLDFLPALRVVLRVGFRFLDHALDIALAQPRRRRDGDLLLLAAGLVLRGHVQDAVGVDVERDLDLREAPWCWRDAFEAEPPQRAVVAGEGPLALQ